MNSTITQKQYQTMCAALEDLRAMFAAGLETITRIQKCLEPADTDRKTEEKPLIKLVKMRGSRRSDSAEFDPAKQAIGQIGGLAGAGISRVSSPRRTYGTVCFKDMTVQAKRQYWRWSAARKTARRLGKAEPTWEQWISESENA
jgi:hypothetical protein